MSRIGKQLIIIPAGVEVKVEVNKIKVKGSKGELTQNIHPMVDVVQKDGQLVVSVKNPQDKSQKALWGLFNRLVFNMIKGVVEGFSKRLEIHGVGYKAVASGSNLVLSVGHSQPFEYKIPAGIEIKIEKNIVTVSGIDKQLVGQTAAEIRAVRKPEPYKGKGIRYIDEVIRRKQGKTAVKSE